MRNYIPKKPRGRCVHIYLHTKGEYKPGDRCKKNGRVDLDGLFHCRLHRTIERLHQTIRKKKHLEKRLSGVNSLITILKAQYAAKAT